MIPALAAALAAAFALALPGVASAGPRAMSPVMAGNAQAPQWSPDGKRLSWELNSHACKRVQLFVLDEAANRLGRVDIARSGAVTLVPVEARAPGDPCAAATGGATAGFSGAAPRAVAQGLRWASQQPATGFGRFAFSAVGADDNIDLYAFDSASGSRVTQAPGADGDLRWLAGPGMRIVFTSARSGDGDLYLVDLDTGGERQLTRAPGSAELYVAAAPDGQRLAYVSHADGGDHIWILGRVDGQATSWRLTTAKGLQTRPSWSPDGLSIAYYDDSAVPGRFDLMVQPAVAGSSPRRLAAGVLLNGDGPSWTPDGRFIVFVLDEDVRFDPVARVEVASGRQEHLKLGTVGNADLSLSRGVDGRDWLAVSAQGREGDAVRDFRRIYVVDLPPAP